MKMMINSPASRCHHLLNANIGGNSGMSMNYMAHINGSSINASGSGYHYVANSNLSSASSTTPTSTSASAAAGADQRPREERTLQELYPHLNTSLPILLMNVPPSYSSQFEESSFTGSGSNTSIGQKHHAYHSLNIATSPISLNLFSYRHQPHLLHPSSHSAGPIIPTNRILGGRHGKILVDKRGGYTSDNEMEYYHNKSRKRKTTFLLDESSIHSSSSKSVDGKRLKLAAVSQNISKHMSKTSPISSSPPSHLTLSFSPTYHSPPPFPQNGTFVGTIAPKARGDLVSLLPGAVKRINRVKENTKLSFCQKIGAPTSLYNAPNINSSLMSSCSFYHRNVPPRPTEYILDLDLRANDYFRIIEYDCDLHDRCWLSLYNYMRKEKNLSPISEEHLEMAINFLEKEWNRLAFPVMVEQGNHIYPDDTQCSICNSAEASNSDMIIFCDRCDVAVHQDCYGIPNVPEGKWLCLPCAWSPNEEIRCCLCPHFDGAFKQTETGRWAHTVCAYWIEETGFSNETYLEPITGVEDIPKIRWSLRCKLCGLKNNGAPIQCSARHCKFAYHVTCAQKGSLWMDYANKKSFCPRHTPLDHMKNLRGIDIRKLRKIGSGSGASLQEADYIDRGHFLPANVRGILEKKRSRNIASDQFNSLPLIKAPSKPSSPSVSSKNTSVATPTIRDRTLKDYWSPKSPTMDVSTSLPEKKKKRNPIIDIENDSDENDISYSYHKSVSSSTSPVKNKGEAPVILKKKQRGRPPLKKNQSLTVAVPSPSKFVRSSSKYNPNSTLSKRNPEDNVKISQIPPVVPEYILNRLLKIVFRDISIDEKESFIIDICKYWTLRRERKGAPLIRRLQMEPSNASVLYNTEQLMEKIEVLKPLRHNLESLRLLLELSQRSTLMKHKLSVQNVKAWRNWKFPLFFEMKGILSYLRKLDSKGIFAKPVDATIVPDYYDIIKNPMDFQMMEEKLNDEQYYTLDEFQSDFDLMCMNAMIYNKSTTMYYKTADMMKKMGGSFICKERFRLEQCLGIYNMDDSMSIDMLGIYLLAFPNDLEFDIAALEQKMRQIKPRMGRSSPSKKKLTQMSDIDEDEIYEDTEDTLFVGDDDDDGD